MSDAAHIEARELLRLHGATVLVDARSERDNAVALRGTVEARPGDGGEPSVKIVLEYPDMFTHPAQRGVITLDGGEARALLASDRGGVLHYTVDQIIDPGIEPAGPQAAS
ncbi:MAG TPA: hypothetical protein VEB66_03475 [Opitutaceae bacterium]|nr:hypothetical protein [Opitutaceae bacterium]